MVHSKHLCCDIEWDECVVLFEITLTINPEISNRKFAHGTLDFQPVVILAGHLPEPRVPSLSWLLKDLPLFLVLALHADLWFGLTPLGGAGLLHRLISRLTGCGWSWCFVPCPCQILTECLASTIAVLPEVVVDVLPSPVLQELEGDSKVLCSLRWGEVSGLSSSIEPPSAVEMNRQLARTELPNWSPIARPCRWEPEPGVVITSGFSMRLVQDISLMQPYSQPTSKASSWQKMPRIREPAIDPPNILTSPPLPPLYPPSRIRVRHHSPRTRPKQRSKDGAHFDNRPHSGQGVSALGKPSRE